MFITDAQVHIWAASTPQRPWPARPTTPHAASFSRGDLLQEMDAAGVARAILVPPSWEGDYSDLVLDAAKRHPDRFAAMGRIDHDAPDARASIREWRKQPGMLGLRFTFKKAALQAPLTDPKLEWLWTEAENAGVPVMMSMKPELLHLAGRVAERHPGLKLVIDHLALPDGEKGDAAFAELDKLLVLARLPNVAAKASAVTSFASDAFPYRSLHPHLRRVYDAFGRKRMFWGTDLTRRHATYSQAIALFTEELPWLSVDDKAWIMGRGVCEWLGWPLPAGN